MHGRGIVYSPSVAATFLSAAFAIGLLAPRCILADLILLRLLLWAVQYAVLPAVAVAALVEVVVVLRTWLSSLTRAVTAIEAFASWQVFCFDIFVGKLRAVVDFRPLVA